MGKIQLFHGTDHIIEKPDFSLRKHHNDYGRGFYCTQNLPIAMEWACKQNTDGFVNKYCLEQDSLQILNLLEPQYNILHWLALLLKNRTFRLYNEIAIDARNYIIENFSINLTDYDIVIGYRADDSYFSFAEAFIAKRTVSSQFKSGSSTGKTRETNCVGFKKAFEHLIFEGAVPADKLIYYPRFVTRDSKAREIYKRKFREDVLTKTIFLFSIF